MSIRIKPLISLLIIGTSTIFLSACSSKLQGENISLETKPSTNNQMNNNSTPIPTLKPSNANEVYASIKTKDGEIVLKLYKDMAPNTVANFINKANSGFYKNLTFHRVIPDFMAQGGDPTGTGMGGGTIQSELNNIPFKRGTIGLARTPETKTVSNDSQFFICFTSEGCQHLTGDYVNFGEVVSGLDILDKISQGDKILDITTQTK
jgi:cyclophilin family peptidyl-prolyl cis-trans isomerase